MNNVEIKSVLDDHKLWLNREGGQQADLRGANLCDANMRGADLRGADLCDANMRGVDLRDANLCGANLWGADLCGANLLDADLCEANLDYSVWPLHCGSLFVKIDARIAAQLVYHAVRACQSVTDDDGVVAFCKSPEVIALANRFHRVDECGRIGEVVKAGESEVAK